MIPFIVAFAFVQVGAWFWGTYETSQGLSYGGIGSSEVWRGFLLPVVLVPVACAWIGAEIAAIVRPLGTRKRTPLIYLMQWSVWGLLAGGLTIVVEGVALTINAERVSDYVIMSACPLMVGGVAAFAFPRAATKGGCPTCGYDWTGLSRCPECGGEKAEVTEAPSAHVRTLAPPTEA